MSDESTTEPEKEYSVPMQLTFNSTVIVSATSESSTLPRVMHRRRLVADSAGWHKPFNWFQRQDKDGIQDACCIKCVEKVAEQSGKSNNIISMF